MKTLVYLDTGKLEEARIKKGLFKREVAKAAGVGESSAYEAFSTGKCGVRVARKIAKALGLELGDLWVRWSPQRG